MKGRAVKFTEDWKVEPYKMDRAGSRGSFSKDHAGDFLTKDNIKLYLGRRATGNDLWGIYKGKKIIYVTQAIKEEEAYWQMSMSEISECKKRDVNIIGVRDIKTGSVWVTDLYTWMNEGVMRVGRNNILFYYLNINKFVKKIYSPKFK